MYTLNSQFPVVLSEGNLNEKSDTLKYFDGAETAFQLCNSITDIVKTEPGCHSISGSRT